MPAFDVLHISPPEALLALLVCIAAAIDWRTYRLPNWLTVGGLVTGLACSAIWPTPTTEGWWSLAGAGAGFACMLPFYVLRVMGAGDVKLMAAVGAFLGVPDVFGALIYTFIAGGVGAIGFALWRRAFGRMAVNLTQFAQGLMLNALGGVRAPLAISPQLSVGKFPYGLAIAAGTLIWLALPLLH